MTNIQIFSFISSLELFCLPMAKMIHLAIADDHKVMRDSICLVVEAKAKKEMKVVINVDDGNELIRQLKKKKADVLILDLQMPGVYAEETVRFLKKKFPKLKIIILTFHREWDKASSLIKAGAKGFITKNFGLDEVIDGIRTVMQGGVYTRNVEYDFELSEKDKKERNEKIEVLKKHSSLLNLLANGSTSAEISAFLKISRKTIEGRKSQLFKMTESKNSNELVAYAMKYGLITSV